MPEIPPPDPVETPVSPATGRWARRPPNWMLLTAGGVVAALALFFFVLAPMLFPTPAPVTATPSTRFSPLPGSPGVPGGASTTTRAPTTTTHAPLLALGHDPFKALPAAATSGATQGTSAGTADTSAGTVDTSSGGTPATTPVDTSAPVGTGPGTATTTPGATSATHVVVLTSITSPGGVRTASTTVDGNPYAVHAGETFATSFKVIDIGTSCADFMNNGTAFTLCTGESIKK